VADHPWPNHPAYQPVVGSPRAVLAVAAVRLIKADPSGPDDRASSHFLIHTGADWRTADGLCPKNASGQNVCPGVGIGRFIYPKVQWRSATFSSMSSQDIASLPPPPADAFRLPDGTFPTD
jgi:hypothetical protein